MRRGLLAGAGARASGEGRLSFLEGDPLFELQRAAHLAGGRYEVLPRALALGAVGALPPLLFTALYGGPWGALVPLLIRFVIAIPVLLWAERFVEQRVTAAVAAFSDRDVVRPGEIPRFQAIVGSADHLLHAPRAAVTIVALAFGLAPVGGLLGLFPHASAIGWWIEYLSLPLFRVVLLLWVWRWIVWAILLARIARLDLRLDPTHPDLTGGLGFIEHAATSFLSLQVAIGAVVAGRLVMVALRGAPIDKQPLAGFAICTIAITLGPLFPFARQLLRAKRLGKLDYGRLASRHSQRFADRWLGATNLDPLGDPSISSLADLGTSYASIDRMRPLPMGRLSLIVLLIVCLAPAVPPLATQVPLREMLTRFVKTVLL